MEMVLKWVCIAITSLWFIGWLLMKNLSIGHRVQIYPILFMGGAIIYVSSDNERSMDNLLWLFPLCFLAGSLVGLLMARYGSWSDDLIKNTKSLSYTSKDRNTRKE